MPRPRTVVLAAGSTGVLALAAAGAAVALTGGAAAAAAPAAAQPKVSASADPSPSTTAVPGQPGHRKGRHLGALRGALHGEATVRHGTGYQTLGEQQGTVTAVSSGSVTLRSADGFTRTYTLTSTSTVRVAGKASSISAVTTSSTARVTAVEDGSTWDVRVLAVPKA